MGFKSRVWVQPTLALVERLFAVWLVHAYLRRSPLKGANFFKVPSIFMMSVSGTVCLELY